MKAMKDRAGHEIRIAAEKGDKEAKKELERRRGNKKGALVPDWEKAQER